MFYVIWLFLGVLFSMVSFFPLVNDSHWVFRIFDFIRLQLLAALLMLLALSPMVVHTLTVPVILVLLIMLVAAVYHVTVVLPYLPIRTHKYTKQGHSIVTLSVNVMQENRDFQRLVALVQRVQPDVLLTMETDQRWEEALSEIEKYFENTIRVPKDNRYGMHLYSKLEIDDFKIHHLISKEHPSIEATFVDAYKNYVTFWAIHPPPPSPTEKPTSKQKDAELMEVARRVRQTTLPTIVLGDFNNVAWSKISKLFGKVSNLKDARLNKGIHGTFPSRFWIFRFPIDLLFHSRSVTVSKIKVLPSIGSDHLPFLCKLRVTNDKENRKTLAGKLEKLTNRTIVKGKEAAIVENEGT